MSADRLALSCCIVGALLVTGLAPGVMAAPMPTSTSILPQYIFRLEPSAALVARLDERWHEASSYHMEDLLAIRFERTEAPRARLSLVPPPPQGDERTLAPAAQVAELLEKLMAPQLLPLSVEKRLSVVTQRAGEVELFTLSATNVHPKPGEFLRVTKGILRLHGVPFGLTLQYDDADVPKELWRMFTPWTLSGAAGSAPTRAFGMDETIAACDRGDALLCGLIDRADQRHDQPPRYAIAGCKAGSPLACAVLGARYKNGGGVGKDASKALDLLVRACRERSQLGCAYALEMITSKQGKLPKGASADPQFYRERLCWLGFHLSSACTGPDDERVPAAEYHARQLAGCERGDARACRFLGWDYETAYGVKADVERALDAYRRACAAADVYGCFRQALLTADTGEQGRLYQAACDMGSSLACYNVSLPAYGLAVDKRIALMRRACESGIEWACIALKPYLGR